MKKMNFAFWKYISLGIFGMIGSAGTILADAFFVSDRLGSTGLAAMNIAMCMFGLMNGTGLLFGIGGATRYTIASAQGNNVRANQVFASSFFTALFMGVAFALTGLLFSNPISYLLGANTETIIMCNIYLKTILCFAPAFVLNHLLMAFVRNDGNPILSTCAMMVGSLANIVLDYLFMYPLGMGIFGAAVATGLAALIGISISCLHFFIWYKQSTVCALKIRLKGDSNGCLFGNILFYYRVFIQRGYYDLQSSDFEENWKYWRCSVWNCCQSCLNGPGYYEWHIPRVAASSQ